MVYVKKRKFGLLKALLLALNFIFLHTLHNKKKFMKQLCWRVAREYVRVNFYF
jgi:hypothetical protein